MKVLACASGFGLGPVGKLSSIMEKAKEMFEGNIRWYACGDKIDTDILEKDLFVEKCWSREEEEITEFVKKHKIKVAIVVLDPDIAIILEKNGVSVFFIDSLPFLWTEADVVPFDSYKYFAQKCVQMNDEASRIMSKVKNLIWVNPIVCDVNTTQINKKYKIVINLGGLHSTIENGRGYINLVLITLLKNLILKYDESEILITCGSKAKETVDKELTENNFKNMHVKTLKQKDFLKYVIDSEIFFTSPGMTTIYETCGYDKKTILLPPQNLSQYYNSEFADKLIKRLKKIQWKKEDLNKEYLDKYLYLGEDEVVEIIFKNIDNASKDNKYKEEFFKQINDVLREEFTGKEVIHFEENGSETIIKELKKWEKENKDRSIE